MGILVMYQVMLVHVVVVRYHSAIHTCTHTSTILFTHAYCTQM